MGDGLELGVECDDRGHDWTLPVVIVDLRDGRADNYRVCSRCGDEEVVPADS
ncbi:MAG: hypothetical protein JOZ37_07025 [Actinobacteria bacterium]|nr:hypothetical protein [Actinomycetota bacterium]MBV8958069.1 hypothetical protein [Actinomycetota bacterium]MBV9663701.1 hypothetical protein [Actinomycetota bacterium]MBV9936451.1 hypothetical protein [Actinomycetota bacterium]